MSCFPGDSPFISYQHQDMAAGYFAHQDPFLGEPSWEDTVDPLFQGPGFDQSLQNYNFPPIQRFLQQPEKVLFSAGQLHGFPSQPFHLEANRPHDTLGSLPQLSETTADSPSNSQESYEDSARSPEHSTAWPSDSQAPQFFDTTSFPVQYGAQTWPSSMVVPRPSHISMNIVQPVADALDVCFKDEAYVDDSKMFLAQEPEADLIRTFNVSRSYCHATDDRLGRALVGDEAPSDNEGTIVVNTTYPSVDEDEDADAENDEDLPAPVHDDSAADDDYHPRRNSRPKRKRPSRPSPPQTCSVPPKRRKTNSSSSSSSSSKTAQPRGSSADCKTCGHSAKDSVSLARHIATVHTRPFVCTFSFAGCSGTFGSKNEWKRHVTSQHLALTFWQCCEGPCGSVGAGASSLSSSSSSFSSSSSSSAPVRLSGRVGSEFNRKDLFTQHLRRMHAPFAVKRKNARSPEWESRVRQLQAQCLKVRRQPPSHAVCPVAGCGVVFRGLNCWDERMEHVGKHLEEARGKSAVESDAGDAVLVRWALREGVIERVGAHGFKLVGAGAAAAAASEDEDEDADGELE